MQRPERTAGGRSRDLGVGGSAEGQGAGPGEGSLGADAQGGLCALSLGSAPPGGQPRAHPPGTQKASPAPWETGRTRARSGSCPESRGRPQSHSGRAAGTPAPDAFGNSEPF